VGQAVQAKTWQTWVSELTGPHASDACQAPANRTTKWPSCSAAQSHEMGACVGFQEFNHDKNQITRYRAAKKKGARYLILQVWSGPLWVGLQFCVQMAHKEKKSGVRIPPSHSGSSMWAARRPAEMSLPTGFANTPLVFLFSVSKFWADAQCADNTIRPGRLNFWDTQSCIAQAPQETIPGAAESRLV